jgi:hypothetical protein
MSYTDIVMVGDRLVAQYTDPYGGLAKVTSGFDVISNRVAKCKHTGKEFKLNRRGNQAALFVGNYKVIGRV